MPIFRGENLHADFQCGGLLAGSQWRGGVLADSRGDLLADLPKTWICVPILKGSELPADFKLLNGVDLLADSRGRFACRLSRRRFACRSS